MPPDADGPRSPATPARPPVRDEPRTAAPRPERRPAEPARPADPPASGAARPAAPTEYDVPFDTGELHALPTGQLLTVGRPASPRVESVAEYEEEDEQRRVYSRVAAVIGSIGAIASLFVGWMLPLSLAAIVFGVLGLRREEHGRVLAFVGIGTGVTGLVFSGVWIGYYAIVFDALPT
ncbi:hypothetical protein [Agromyces tropicus]